MLNLRQIDSKFWLSGGWVDVPLDAKELKGNRFRAVLDLQFAFDDYTKKSASFIEDVLKQQSIEYLAVPMNDGENPNIERIYDLAYNQLTDWDSKFRERNDRILVKCGVGVSRSVSVMIYYFCMRDRLTYNEARAIVSRADGNNYGGLPIGIEQALEVFLKGQFPDPKASAFGEVE